MRIALITAQSPLTRAADADHQQLSLARALADLGHRVTIYARREDAVSPGTAIMGGVSVEQITAGPKRPLVAEQAARHMPELAAQLSARFASRRPDVVHAFSWVAGLAAIGAVRGTEIPVVQSFESLASLQRREAGAPVSASRVKLEASIGRTVDAVLAGSEDEAAELARLAVPKAAVRIIPAGVDTTVFSPEGEQAESGPRTRLVAFAAGGNAAGLATVVRALTQLPETELVIAGGPDARHLPRTGPFRALAQLATALGVRNRVTFAGQLSPADLAALLRSAAAVVSSVRYDPAGESVLQAMACGTPAVAAAVGGQRDAIVDGITGMLIAPEHPAMLVQRLRLLLGNPALRQAYGIAAADRVRSRYGFDRIGRETAAAYARCVQARTAAVVGSAEEELAELADDLDLRGVAAFA